MIPPAPQWSHVLEEARRLAAARGERFDTEVFSALGDLIRYASPMSPEPVVSLGYWNTIQLDWPGLSLEVFEDRVEVYPQSPPGSPFAVWYEQHSPGSEFSDDFERALPKLPD